MIKILAFPFAGGNKYSFSNLILKNNYTKVFEYRSRMEFPIKEDLIENINELVGKLCLKIRTENHIDDEYVIYGHSMGALVGYLLCKEIEKLNLKKPLKLIVSGKSAPKYAQKEILHKLPDNEFLDKVMELGGIPKEIKGYPEFIKYYVPILKSDFKYVGNYQYDENSPKLSIPIDVFYGSHEDMTKEEALAWQEETTCKINVTQLKGNHFFIFEHQEFFVEYFKNLQENATI